MKGGCFIPAVQWDCSSVSGRAGPGRSIGYHLRVGAVVVGTVRRVCPPSPGGLLLEPDRVGAEYFPQVVVELLAVAGGAQGPFQGYQPVSGVDFQVDPVLPWIFQQGLDGLSQTLDVCGGVG